MNILEEVNKKVVVIAEIGCNHNGELDIARKLVDVAAKAGADVAKFQSFRPKDMTTAQAPKADYQLKATGTAESQYNRLRRMSLSEETQIMLKQLCESREIVFASSPFDLGSVTFLDSLDVPFFKIPSGEITNIPLLEHIASFGRPVILSTGMSTLGEVEEAIYALGEKNRSKIILMHCLSNYPSVWDEANLRAIKTLRAAFNLPVGFSDHSVGIELPLVALGFGACVIEKHITLDKNMEGGDHKASLEPQEFEDMVRKIRLLEKAFGDGIKRCMPSEENVRKVIRKSLVVNRKISKGQIIDLESLSVKRPGTGISPKYFHQVAGSKAKMNIESDQILDWLMIELTDKNKGNKL